MVDYADCLLKIVEDEVDDISLDIQKDPAIGLKFSLVVLIYARDEAFDAYYAHVIAVL